MNLEGNTVLITGGNSGIGRALAEALHARGNKVIIAGRRKEALADTVRANPGMGSFELDVTDPSSVATVSAELLRRHPRLNVLINNAGIMKVDDVARAIDEEQVASTIATNLVAPIRLRRSGHRAWRGDRTSGGRTLRRSGYRQELQDDGRRLVHGEGRRARVCLSRRELGWRHSTIQR